MAMNRYIGMRYVPKIEGEHSTERAYEALSIVTNNGSSYTSKRDVPIGTALSNTDYWVLTGNYNAQVDYYRSEVTEALEDVEEAVTHVEETASDMDSSFDTKIAQLTASFDTKMDEMDSRYSAQVDALDTSFSNRISQLNNSFNNAISDVNESISAVDAERQQMVSDFNTAIANIGLHGAYFSSHGFSNKAVDDYTFLHETYSANYTYADVGGGHIVTTLTLTYNVRNIPYNANNIMLLKSIYQNHAGRGYDRLPNVAPDSVNFSNDGSNYTLTLSWLNLDPSLYGTSSRNVTFDNLIFDIAKLH